MGNHTRLWILAFLGSLIAAGAVMGQTVETTQTVERADSLFDLLAKGGIVMIPLALCSLMAVTITMERYFSMSRKSIMPDQLDDEIEELLDSSQSNKIEKARESCDEHPSVLADIYRVALDHWEKDPADAEKSMADTASLHVRRLRRRVKPMRLIGTVSPLFGLLGTVLGMIQSFQTVALSSQSINKAELLAEGIYQAMVTTAAGLTIAIPTLLVFFYFNNRVDKISEELEEKGNQFVFKYFRSRFKLEA